MLKPERQAFILHRVNLHNQVLSANLKATFISGSLPVALEYTHHP
jgi:hypothetical protein